MLLLIYPQNVHGASSDVIVFIFNHLHGKKLFALLSTLFRRDLFLFGFLNVFRSNLPLSNNKKIDKKFLFNFL